MTDPNVSPWFPDAAELRSRAYRKIIFYGLIGLGFLVGGLVSFLQDGEIRYWPSGTLVAASFVYGGILDLKAANG